MTLYFNNGRVTLGNARLYNGAYIATRWFRGKIDEAGLWNRPLSAGEVAKLYNTGNGLLSILTDNDLEQQNY